MGGPLHLRIFLSSPGDVAEEAKGTSHWWKNTGKTTAVLISADLLHQNDDEHMM